MENEKLLDAAAATGRCQSWEVDLEGPQWPGYCSICEREVVFYSRGPWHRDELICLGCGSIPRQRALMSVLSMVRPDWRDARIWELAPAGSPSNKLKAECRGYLGSHYWPGVPSGSDVNGVRCEDLEHPSLGDASFDVVVSMDVFEHVVDVETALAQIARILVPDGIHVWTAPQSASRENSVARVRRSADGLEHLVPAEYHGDPVNENGVLVTYDWGRDLPDVVERASAMTTTVFRMESKSHGLLGEFLEVFVSRKRQAIARITSDALTARPVDTTAEPIPSDSRTRIREDVRSIEAMLRSVRVRLDALEGRRSWQSNRALRGLRHGIRRGR